MPLSRADALRKALGCIALSTSSFKGEARTAAIAACRLIREHKLVLSLEEPPRNHYTPQPAQPPRPPVVERIVIKSKFAGWCRACGTPFAISDKIAWARGEGSLCLPCNRKKGS